MTVLELAVAAAIVAIWAAWIGRQPEAPRWTRILPWVVLPLTVAGGIFAMNAFQRAYRDALAAPKEESAHRLSEGIARGMDLLAFAHIPVLAAAVVLVFVTVRVIKKRKPEASEVKPPLT
jgi:hypothetical protein